MKSFKFRPACTALAAAAVVATTTAVWAVPASASAPGSAPSAAASAVAANGATAVAHNVSLVQAIATAEQHANGNASKAEIERTRAGWIYKVEVVSGAKVFDVKVDATQGSVISSTEDTPDWRERFEAWGEHHGGDRHHRRHHEDDDD